MWIFSFFLNCLFRFLPLVLPLKPRNLQAKDTIDYFVKLDMDTY